MLTRATLVAHVQDDPQVAPATICGAAQELRLTLALFPVRTSGLLPGWGGDRRAVLAVSGLIGAPAVTQLLRNLLFGIGTATPSHFSLFRCS